MNTDMQELSRAYQRGIEVGRAAAKHEMDEFMALTKAVAQHVTTASAGSITGWRAGKAATNPKAPITAGAGKKAPMARTKGVKEAIMKTIGEHNTNGVTTGEIIAETGHKKTSVRATLMSMKRVGQAIQDGPNWFLPRGMTQSGNSDAGVASEY